VSVARSTLGEKPGSRPGGKAKPAFRLPVRTLVTSTAFPPLKAGHAVVLDRMFRQIHPDDYRIVHFDEFMDHEKLEEGWPALPAKTFRYPMQWWHWAPSYPLSYVRRIRDLAGVIGGSARTLARICSDEDCKVIVATTGSLPRLPAAVLAGRLARVPVVLLIWDIWRFMEVEPLHRFIAQGLEPAVLRGAAAVVVPNEMAAEQVARLCGVQPEIIRLPVDDAAFADQDIQNPPRSAANDFRLVFTGQVYISMTEPYKRLLSALDQPGMENVSLDIFGPQKKEWLQGIGLEGRYECHGFITTPELYSVQRSADALFLALAFEGQHKNLVYSSSTSKLPDYLASGRPIIVHAPPGSFPAWYVRRHECGLVVDTPDVMALARAIAMLRDDDALRLRLGRNAMIRARTDFSIAAAQQRLADLLVNVTRGHV
jgi:glycosyltransferase involved in cell wall biosynthesis